MCVSSSFRFDIFSSLLRYNSLNTWSDVFLPLGLLSPPSIFLYFSSVFTYWFCPSASITFCEIYLLETYLWGDSIFISYKFPATGSANETPEWIVADLFDSWTEEVWDLNFICFWFQTIFWVERLTFWESLTSKDESESNGSSYFGDSITDLGSLLLAN